MVNKQVLLKLVLLIGYAGLIFHLLLTGKVSLYLHPKMNSYILASGIVLIVLALVAAKDLFEKTHSHQGYTAYGIFLMALMLALLVEPISLNSVLAENRGVTIGKSQVENTDHEQERTRLQPDETTKLQDDGRAALELIIDEDNYVATLGDIYSDTDAFLGRKITISGFVFRDQKMQEEYFVIARSAVNCCTADASPMGLLCEFKEAGTLQKDDWVRVTGVLKETTVEGQKSPLLVVNRVEKIQKPQEEYIYLD